MDLEVEVRRCTLGVPRSAHEAHHVARLHAGSVDGEGREGREVSVVVVVAVVVAKPEAVAADAVPADVEEGPVRNGQERSPDRRKDVVPVVPAGRGAARAEVVCERGRPVDREDETLRRDLGLDAGRRVLHDRRLRRRLGSRGRRGRLRSRRRHRIRLRRLGLRRARGGLRITDEDLAPGRQPAVVGGQVNVQADDEAPLAEPLPLFADNRLFEEHCVAPITQRKARVRSRLDGLTENGHRLDYRRAEAPGAPGSRGPGRRGQPYRPDRDLTRKERDGCD
jgi:hypothetical protein